MIYLVSSVEMLIKLHVNLNRFQTKHIKDYIQVTSRLPICKNDYRNLLYMTYFS